MHAGGANCAASKYVGKCCWPCDWFAPNESASERNYQIIYAARIIIVVVVYDDDDDDDEASLFILARLGIVCSLGFARVSYVGR